MDKFIKAEIEDARIARAILNNETMNPVKLWLIAIVSGNYSATTNNQTMGIC